MTRLPSPLRLAAAALLVVLSSAGLSCMSPQGTPSVQWHVILDVAADAEWLDAHEVTVRYAAQSTDLPAVIRVTAPLETDGGSFYSATRREDTPGYDVSINGEPAVFEVSPDAELSELLVADGRVFPNQSGAVLVYEIVLGPAGATSDQYDPPDQAKLLEMFRSDRVIEIQPAGEQAGENGQ